MTAEPTATSPQSSSNHGPSGKRLLLSFLVSSIAALMLSSCASSLATSTPRVIGKPDQLCNGGKGFHITTSAGVLGSGATASSTTGLSLVPGSVIETSNGHTLLSFNSIDASFNSGPVRILSLTSDCAIDESFGNHGILDPSVTGTSAPLTTFGLAKGLGGNFFVISNGNDNWLIGEFTSSGTIDNNFGNQGWVSVIPPAGYPGYEPSISDLQVTKSGTILILGDNAEPHVDVQPYLYELNANGSVNTYFGSGGHVALFSTFVYAGQLLLQPNGDIVTTGQSGGAGCYSMPFEWLNPTGYPLLSIDSTFNASRPIAVRSEVFWGSIFPDQRGGVGIVVLSASCDISPSHASSEIQEFHSSGMQLNSFGEHGTVKISTPNPYDFDFSATTLPNHHLVVESYEDESSTNVNIRDFDENGHAVIKFGYNGLMKLRVPSLLTTYAGPSNVVTAARGDIGLLIPVKNGLTFKEIIG